MSTLWLESILVGYVRDLVGLAVVVGVAVATLCLQGLVVGADIVEMAFLLSLNTITSLVAVVIGSVGVGPVQSLFDDRDWAGVVDGGGDCHCYEGAQSDYLERQRIMRSFIINFDFILALEQRKFFLTTSIDKQEGIERAKISSTIFIIYFSFTRHT